LICQFKGGFIEKSKDEETPILSGWNFELDEFILGSESEDEETPILSGWNFELDEFILGSESKVWKNGVVLVWQAFLPHIGSPNQ
jgi:hypothetical protein